jgi:hypothetical protein
MQDVWVNDVACRSFLFEGHRKYKRSFWQAQ